MLNRIKRGLALAILVPATVALAAPTTASARTSPLSYGQARSYANNFAFNNWYPPSWSVASGWDQVDPGTLCVRWTRYRLDCVVGTTAQNYDYDPEIGSFGYAYCVGTVVVKKITGLYPHLTGRSTDLSCDATD